MSAGSTGHMGSKFLLQRSEALLKEHLNKVYEYLTDPTVQEVMINSSDNIWLECNGNYERLDLSISDASLTSAITLLANLNKKGTTPLINCQLPGLRVAATLPPVSAAGPSLSIRRHSSRVFTLEDYLASGSFDRKVVVLRPVAGVRPADADVAEGGVGLVRFLDWMVKSRANFVISGSTSSGKTALLNALAGCIPMTDRVITIEDTAELRIQAPNHVSFEANEAYGIHIRDLVRHTLRYRPNRILVGEIRGAEAFDMLDAYNTGHPGSAVSYHSDSPALALSRLENMIRMAPEAVNWPLEDLRRQIASTFKFVLHASNVEGKRGPIEVMELLGTQDGGYRTKTLFKKEYVYEDDSLPLAA